jgi:hypothetical protein
VEKLAESCNLTDGNGAALHAHAVRVWASDLRYRSEWVSLELGRHGSHLGARGVQPMKRLLPRCAADEMAAEGQGNSWLLRRPHIKVCAREGAA